MVDDLGPARPQSGFNAASVVWQAPAEGGIPRYMMVFQENIPGHVGPVRSSRYYYIAWAAEWRALYAHAGGSPQALRDAPRRRATASSSTTPTSSAGRGRSGGWTTSTRPHNLYTDGEHLRKLANSVKAKDGAMEPAWNFAPDLPVIYRPRGGRHRDVLPVQPDRVPLRLADELATCARRAARRSSATRPTAAGSVRRTSSSC